MSKDSVSDWDTTAGNNTDIGGINIDEQCPPSGLNNAIRAMMAQIKTALASFPVTKILTGDGTVAAPAVAFTSDTDTGLYRVGANNPAIGAGGKAILDLVGGTTAVNYLRIAGATANGVVAISAQGDDTNLGLSIATKGTDALQLYVGTLEAVRINASASAVNYFTLTASATGAALQITASGETDVSINIDPKGAGVLQVNGNTLADASSNIPVARLNSGTSASSSTFWRGDGAWAAPLTKFTSSDITITAGSSGNQTLAHGLGAAPFGVGLSLVAQATPELGYAEGDEVRIDFGTTSGNNGGWGVVADATNVNLYPSTALSHVLPHKSTNTITAIDLSKWKVRVRAWL